VISFHRPVSMTETELRAWIAERARARQPQLALGIQDGSVTQQWLRVAVPTDSIEAAEEQVAELMMDMRLSGLRPTVLPACG
jgi:hypothetical protein